MIRRVLLLLCLVSLPASAATSSLWDAESRWRYLAGEDDPSKFQAYLLDFPDSPHVDAARAWLAAWDNAPLARLQTPGCATTLQARAQHLLDLAPRPADREQYELVVPADHFLTSPTLVVVPRGLPAAETPIERQLVLNLVAKPSGACLLMQRWSTGSGLPAECRCSPLDPAYRFPSPRAEQVLREYASLKAVNAFCVDRGSVDRLPQIEGYFTAATEIFRGRADSLPVGNSERAEYEAALAAMADKPERPEAFRVQSGVLEGMDPKLQRGLCRDRLEQRIAQGRAAL